MIVPCSSIQVPRPMDGSPNLKVGRVCNEVYSHVIRIDDNMLISNIYNYNIYLFLTSQATHVTYLISYIRESSISIHFAVVCSHIMLDIHACSD